MQSPRSLRRHLSLSLSNQEQLLRRGLYNKLVKAVLSETKNTNAPLRVLDVGVGRGELMRILDKRGCDVSGMDVDEECVLLGQKVGRCMQGEIKDICNIFNPGEFDVIVCSHVLEHVNNPHDALESMAAMKAKYYVFAIPNPLRSIRILRAVIGSRRPDHKEHVYSWGHAEFSALLLRVGLFPVTWYEDRVTLNPFRGRFGTLLTRLLTPVESIFLPKLLPMLSSSIIVRCRLLDAENNL